MTRRSPRRPFVATLSVNDLVLAQSAVQINLSWWRKQPGGSDYRRRMMRALDRLNVKLGAIIDAAPDTHPDDAPLYGPVSVREIVPKRKKK